VARMGEKRNVFLVGKPEGKRPLGRPKCGWIDNMKVYLLQIGSSVVDWIGLAQDRYRWRALVNSVMNLRFHKMLGNYRLAAQLVASRVVYSPHALRRCSRRSYSLSSDPCKPAVQLRKPRCFPCCNWFGWVNRGEGGSDFRKTSIGHMDCHNHIFLSSIKYRHIYVTMCSCRLRATDSFRFVISG
jgi:hypothetical protein